MVPVSSNSLRVALVQLDAPRTSRRMSRARRSSLTRRPRAAPAWSPCPSTSSTAATTTASAPRRGRSPGRTPTPFCEVARRRDAWILVGSTAETSRDPRRPYNTSALIAPDGVDRRDVPQDPSLRCRGRRRAGGHRVSTRDRRRQPRHRGCRRHDTRPDDLLRPPVSRSCTARSRWPAQGS